MVHRLDPGYSIYDRTGEQLHLLSDRCGCYDEGQRYVNDFFHSTVNDPEFQKLIPHIASPDPNGTAHLRWEIIYTDEGDRLTVTNVDTGNYIWSQTRREQVVMEKMDDLYHQHIPHPAEQLQDYFRPRPPMQHTHEEPSPFWLPEPESLHPVEVPEQPPRPFTPDTTVNFDGRFNFSESSVRPTPPVPVEPARPFNPHSTVNFDGNFNFSNQEDRGAAERTSQPAQKKLKTSTFSPDRTVHFKAHLNFSPPPFSAKRQGRDKFNRQRNNVRRHHPFARQHHQENATRARRVHALQFASKYP